MPKGTVKRFKTKATRVTKKAKTDARNMMKDADGIPIQEINVYGPEPMTVADGKRPVSMSDA